MTDGSHGFGETFIMVNGMLRRVAAGSFLLAMAACLCVCPAFAAGIFRVNAASAADTPDGSSWDKAYKTLQEGTDAAEAAGGGEVWVCAGVYTSPTYMVLWMDEGVSVYGGFAGTETTRNARNWAKNPCVIDGQNRMKCVDCYGDGVLDGFLIIRGRDYSGAGVYASGSPTIENCQFIGNSANTGGGLYGGNCQVRNCVFRQNRATGYGGAAYLWGSSTTTAFLNCSFAGNSAGAGQAIYNDGGYGTLVVKNCILWDESASSSQPEIHNASSSYNVVASYSCIKDGSGGTGNIFTDPMFVDPSGTGSVQLRSGSPCLDAATAVTGMETDLLGRPRVQGLATDMGAYEGSVAAADIVNLITGISPEGSGRVFPAPGETHYFGRGEPVVLSALPLGRRFDAWSGDFTGTSRTAAFLIAGNSAVTASFVDNIVRVNAAQQGPADGTTWETAYASIWEAVYAVEKDGGEVWVARGSYAGNGSTVVVMESGVNIYGGFAGDEDERSGRDLSAGATVIDGEGANRCVVGSDDAVLDGFTIMGGRANSGGGMYNAAVSPTIANCIFIANRAATGSGAGVYNYRSSAAFANCVFARNIASDTGGALYNSDSSPMLINCTFSGNHAAVGGGIYQSGGSALVTNCILWGNTARTDPELSGTSGEIAASYSCVQGGYVGAGNLDGDPLWVGGNDGSLQLRAGSPCLDSGIASGTPATDLLGRARPQGGGVDMGAYEGSVAEGDTVTLTVALSPEDGGSTQPGPGTHLHARGETVPLFARGLGHRFAAWTGDIAATTPQASILMDGANTVTAEFSDNIVRVNCASPAATPDGMSWDTAYRTVQEAIDAAEKGGGGQVWVGAGTYTSSSAPIVAMKPGVYLYGGFVGTEADLAQRDWRARASVIDGEQARRCVTGADYTLLDGFTVQCGHADYPDGAGGGMLNNGASPTVRNCIFSKNRAASSGGAMYNENAGPEVVNCIFLRNSTDTPSHDYYPSDGGGAIDSYVSSLTLRDCTFTANTSGANGGALSQYETMLDAVNCVFTLNVAQDSGGTIFNDANVFGGMLTNCTFSQNSAGMQGGAMVDDYSSTLTNCILWGNLAAQGFPEIASGNSGGSPTVVRYSCVQGGYGGEGNSDSDPLFVGDAAGSAQLRNGSPCADTGTRDGAPATDLLGRPRPAGAGVDMGAYEGTVDSADMTTLTIQVSPEGAGRTMPAAGTHQFTRGETAVVAASGIGWRFVKWSGAVDDASPEILLVMDGDKTVTAEFEPFVAYANSSSAGAGDGKTWDTAYSTLQAAVDAVAAGGGGELWVAKGTYTDEKDPVLIMRPGVFMFGGFAGSETARDQRDWKANVAAIDGEGQFCCVVGADNATLDGFTVTNGAATYSHEGGAGMFNNGVSPTVAHCVFANNAADPGGGMCNKRSSSLITDCVFRQNGMISGDGNYNDLLGGGMYNEGGSPSIIGCRFEGNMATVGGAMCNEESAPVIQACTFTENLTQQAGYSWMFGGGAAICNIQASPVITGCLFESNADESDSSSNGGGAILNRWLPCNSTYSPPIPTVILVENCVFFKNSTTTHGDAICNIKNPLKVINCTFAGNGFSGGEAIYNDGYIYEDTPTFAQPVISNSIVWGGGSALGCQIVEELASYANYPLLVDHSCVQGGYSGTGNIEADPMFMNFVAGDLHLGPASPCIDRGTADGAPPADVAGMMRPQGAGFDMGAFEYDGTPPNAPVIAGPSGPTNNPLPAFSWTSGGNAGANVYRYGFAEGLWLALDSVDTAFTPASALPDGRYIFYVQERDASGNWSVSGTRIFVIDTLAPSAPSVQGTPSPSNNPRPAWTWTTGGGGEHLYRCGYSEDSWLTGDIAESTFTPRENLADGSHTLYVQERDAAGNWSASGSFSVMVDTTAPGVPVVVASVTPANSARPTWTWISGGNGGIGLFRFGYADGAWLASETTAASFTPDIGLADGAHTLFVQERDAVGNWSASSSATVNISTVVYHDVTVQQATGGGITLDPPRPPGGYVQGTTITVVATVNTGYTFIHWTGDLSGTANPASLVVDTDKTVGAVFASVATEGETVEGEGEGQPPVSIEAAAQRLKDSFAVADTDQSGTLSEAEAMAAVPGMTHDQFAQLDANGDGQITQEELDAALNPNTGCTCKKSTFTPIGVKSRLADLFTFGLAMTIMLVVRGRKQ